jgi:hypothetical protein
VEALRQQLLDLEAEFKAETDQVGANVDSLAAPLETVTMRPTKRNVTVTLLALAWSPEWQDPGGQVTSAWR